MDALCGFVRGIRGKPEELGVFPVEMRAFPGQFSTTSWEKIFETCARLAEPPPGVYRIPPKQPGYIRVKSVFLSGQKPPREAPGR